MPLCQAASAGSDVSANVPPPRSWVHPRRTGTLVCALHPAGGTDDACTEGRAPRGLHDASEQRWKSELARPGETKGTGNWVGPPAAQKVKESLAHQPRIQPSFSLSSCTKCRAPPHPRHISREHPSSSPSGSGPCICTTQSQLLLPLHPELLHNRTSSSTSFLFLASPSCAARSVDAAAKAISRSPSELCSCRLSSPFGIAQRSSGA